ncbi:GGDEF domain-containing protein [Psychromonas ossibalaenae]|uniref:GGDEF domain-containing protein n=1 Tax=Psychromonas ossibalaenae TaxID=444922 RepID=UPI0003609349|nr:diguanylate cyclase [Psychromonas ossibalaenae]
MGQYKNTQEKLGVDSIDFESQGQSDIYLVMEPEEDYQPVIDITNYKQTKQAVNTESSAFDQAMSQMNIADRAAFDVYLARSWQEAANENEMLSVLRCNIDCFKSYHDNYGHQASSFMLLVIGLALKNICEKHDSFLARYKNHDFVVLIKGGDQIKSQIIAESLRQAVEETNTEHKHSSVSKIVTLSIGLSSVHPNTKKILINQAQSTLSEAIDSGRNKICEDFTRVNKRTVNKRTVNIKQQTIQAPVVKQSALKQMMLIKSISERSTFQPDYKRLWKESLEQKKLLSIFICEIDFFKPYIANYGVHSSEVVLLSTACLMQEVCEKANAVIFYMDGEHFIILFKGGCKKKALNIAQSIQKNIAKSAIEHKHSKVSNYITLSFGISSLLPSNNNSMKVLMIEASTALDNAIRSRRNQICVH